MESYSSNRSKIQPIRINLYIGILIAGWLVAVVFTAIFDIYQEKQKTVKNTMTWARTYLDKDLLYRQWNTAMGGVYVQVGDKVPPNPHLSHLPERDLNTSSGRFLTLVNPAYMTRLVYEMNNRTNEFQGHLTSLRPISPKNAPDAWETEALRAFEQGKTEVATIVKNGKSYFRLMRPFLVQEGCLKCHSQQGYKIGDVRGGISVTLPMPDFTQIYRAHLNTYGPMGLLGLVGILLVARGMKRNIRQREQAEEALYIANGELEARVQERTAELKTAIQKLQGEVAERRLAEENLAQMRHRHELILQAAEEGIVGLDVQGKVTFLNPAAARFTGYEPHELLGRPLHESVHHTLSDGGPSLREQCPVCAVLRDGLVHDSSDSVFWSKDGRPFPVELVASPVKENGELAGAVLVFRDISERKQLEGQLFQAQKMEAVGRLAGGVAHDFNNILGVIIGYTEIMLMGHDPGEALYLQAREVKNAADRAAMLTRQLLAFSRRQVLQPQIINFNSVVSDIEKMLNRLIGEDIDLATRLDPSAGNVKADPGQIEQVIMNLAVNARDAMPGGGKLTIETTGVSLAEDYANAHIDVSPGDYVVLAVSDNGVGMDAQTQGHIFEPFFTTKKEEKGTGLGLATVYGIVKQSGGHIWVYSEPGQGTTFKIYLPRVSEKVKLLKTEAVAPARLEGLETILVVEDDHALRRMVCEILRLQGYSVLETDNGQEALDIAKRHQEQIHLLLTDVVMPKMGGRELAEQLSSRSPQMKVLYMSGYTENAIDHQGVLDKGMHFIPKPFTPADLGLKVREVLDSAPEKS